MDSLRKQLEQPDTLQIDSVALRDSIAKIQGIDSMALALRDSLYTAMASVREADSLGIHIEDYSVGHIALKNFFNALRQCRTDRPVRVAFLGDSFIEGDILVSDFRSALQRMFGGRGVGFVPVHSVAAQYRPTVKVTSTGWKTWSMLHNYTKDYIFSGMLFEQDSVPDSKKTLSLEATDFFPELDSVPSVKLIYQRNRATKVRFFSDRSADTFKLTLPPTDSVIQYNVKGPFNKAGFIFSETDSFQLIGAAMEADHGVTVDNFSLRGNSGIIMNRLDSNRCRQLNKVRPYDLIVLQYGLNVVNDSILQYGWYTQKMEETVRHIQRCFPKSDILLMGVSDRARQEDGNFETMPAVLALLNAQRRMAKRSGIAFWNTFGAMGGENSMVRYVEINWASKDYTHLGFRGGKEIAKMLLNAILLEKEFYDKADTTIE